MGLFYFGLLYFRQDEENQKILRQKCPFYFIGAHIYCFNLVFRFLLDSKYPRFNV
jgi:hypothetical protein